MQASQVLPCQTGVPVHSNVGTGAGVCASASGVDPIQGFFVAYHFVVKLLLFHHFHFLKIPLTFACGKFSSKEISRVDLFLLLF